MDKLLFKHELFDEFGLPISSISILDNGEDNVIIDDKKYTLSSDCINRIKELLSDDILYRDDEVLFPPVLDGTKHKIYLLNDKTIEGNNLWYWIYDDAFDNIKKDVSKKHIEYTMAIVYLIMEIQNMLDENSIDYYIIDDE